MISAVLLASAFFSAFTRVLYKQLMRDNSEVAVIVAVQSLAAIIGVPLALAFLPTVPFDWPLLIIQSLLWGGFVFFEIRAFRHLDLGVAAILGSSEYVLQLILGVLIFGEILHAPQLLGAVLITAGIAISTDWRKPDIQTGVVYQAMSVVCLLAVLPIDTILSRQVSPWFVSAFAYIGTSAVLFLWRRSERGTALTLMRRSGRTQLAAVCNLLGYALMLYALTVWSYSDTVTTSQTSLCFSLFLGWLVLGERQHLARKLVACALVMTGVALFGSAA